LEVKNPLFIIGTGRCGSTILHQILSHHPNVTWLSPWCVKYPDRPEINRFAIKIIDLPPPIQYLRRYVHSGECYPFWEHHAKGFTDPSRNLGEEDVSRKTKNAVRKFMAGMLTPKRSHLVVKLTGWPRTGFLKEIFPDAKFIHIYRDGRAVVNSWLQTRWWKGWRGPENWTRGELTAAQRQKWEKYGKSFVVLAAIEWEILMSAYDKAKHSIPPDDFLEIRYENLCQRPAQLFRIAAEFIGLDWSPKFEGMIQKFPLICADDKWRKDLSDMQQKMLEEALCDTLRKYGYAQETEATRLPICSNG
jgi:sulfotransferase family protein